MSLYEHRKDQRGEFEILAFHDESAKDFAELDAKLEPIADRIWKGKSLPFPILLDSTGETVRLYGIEHFPTLVLIDPQGRVVGEVGEEMLEEVLRKSRETGSEGEEPAKSKEEG
jgi:hypothetical protein